MCLTCGLSIVISHCIGPVDVLTYSGDTHRTAEMYAQQQLQCWMSYVRHLQHRFIRAHHRLHHPLSNAPSTSAPPPLLECTSDDDNDDAAVIDTLAASCGQHLGTRVQKQIGCMLTTQATCMAAIYQGIHTDNTRIIECEMHHLYITVIPSFIDYLQSVSPLVNSEHGGTAIHTHLHNVYDELIDRALTVHRNWHRCSGIQTTIDGPEMTESMIVGVTELSRHIVDVNINIQRLHSIIAVIG